MDTANALRASKLFDVRGWTAVVTGGGTGIGLIAAQTLAANGAKVYITGRRKKVLDTSAAVHGSATALGDDLGSLVPLVMDVTSKASITAAVAAISETETHVNLLVNNAGIGSRRADAAASQGPETYGKAMFNEDEEDWQRVYSANNTSVYFTTAAFIPLLAKAVKSRTCQPGNVINISSQSGITKWSQNSQYAYNCSKAATNHLTRMLAYELCDKHIGIRVNALCPGYFPSELTTGSSNKLNKTEWDHDKFTKEMARVGANVPVGRPGSDQEMGNAILFLATNSYVLGICLASDGGILLRHPAIG